MPKIYDRKQEPESDREPSPGGPGVGPVEKRGMMLAIAVILAVIVLVMVYRMARGEEVPWADMQAMSATTSFQHP